MDSAAVKTRNFWRALKAFNINDAVRAIGEGADVNAMDEGKTPMQFFAENPRLAKDGGGLFDRMLNAGANIDDTCLYRACFTQNVSGVKLLLRAKRFKPEVHFNPNIIHPVRRDSPLFVAVRNENPAITMYLLEDPEIDPNLIVTDDNISALFYAAGNNLFDIIELFLRNPRTDPNIGAGNLTPLHSAAYTGHIRCVRMLLEHPRTNPNLVDEYDRTPLDMAKKIGNQAIVKILQPLQSAPPPLTTAPTSHQYAEVPKIIDLISLEETPITDLDDSNLIFKFNDSYFARTKESIRKELDNDDHVIFKCRVQPALSPSVEQIYADTKYFVLTGGPMNITIPLNHILGALVHPTNTFDIQDAGEVLPLTADYRSVVVRGGRGYKRREVEAVSVDHCQAGTDKPLYHLHPLTLEAAPAAEPVAAVPEAAAGGAGAAAPRRRVGGRRKTQRRRQQHRRFSASRKQKN